MSKLKIEAEWELDDESCPLLKEEFEQLIKKYRDKITGNCLISEEKVKKK